VSGCGFVSFGEHGLEAPGRLLAHGGGGDILPYPVEFQEGGAFFETWISCVFSGLYFLPCNFFRRFRLAFRGFSPSPPLCFPALLSVSPAAQSGIFLSPKRDDANI
jgi:hypothetical protein